MNKYGINPWGQQQMSPEEIVQHNLQQNQQNTQPNYSGVQQSAQNYQHQYQYYNTWSNGQTVAQQPYTWAQGIGGIPGQYLTTTGWTTYYDPISTVRTEDCTFVFYQVENSDYKVLMMEFYE